MNSRSVFVIDAGTLYTPRQKISPARIVIEGKAIAAVGSPEAVPIPRQAELVDATSWIATPGFIDPHIHGCGGVDVMEGTYEVVNVVSRILARHGTTGFLATTVSAPPKTLSATVGRLGDLVPKQFDGARLLGIHLEGPFINPTTRGTHKAADISRPDPELLHNWITDSGSNIRLLTLAPEIEGNEALSLMAPKYGIRVAMGHSNATLEQASAAAERGVCYAVHTFNAMRPFAHRDPGIIGAVLTDDRIFAEVIADGIHVHPAAVSLVARAKNQSRVLLVTDAISATDMPDGEYSLGSDRVRVSDGICRDSEGRLAGSTLTQEIALRNFIAWTGVSLQQALFSLTENPASALGLHDKGVVEPGGDADLTIMDSGFRVMKTFVAGKLVFQR